jgi:hypothetical protein
MDCDWDGLRLDWIGLDWTGLDQIRPDHQLFKLATVVVVVSMEATESKISREELRKLVSGIPDMQLYDSSILTDVEKRRILASEEGLEEHQLSHYVLNDIMLRRHFISFGEFVSKLESQKDKFSQHMSNFLVGKLFILRPPQFWPQVPVSKLFGPRETLLHVRVDPAMKHGVVWDSNPQRWLLDNDAYVK